MINFINIIKKRLVFKDFLVKKKLNLKMNSKVKYRFIILREAWTTTTTTKKRSEKYVSFLFVLPNYLKEF